ncbi:hypothetical protein LCM20_01180 [Halobacillus litoralis]|uniref:hypothetical protein n=1 Tax=Halobacillus litoralis TaxID=45668 RepID=UPI001CD31457|nr:hypothetical protein [Halobacillus litoralis]MCA0969197.1 hypothetical protein [Halobacillus litoralis]
MKRKWFDVIFDDHQYKFQKVLIFIIGYLLVLALGWAFQVPIEYLFFGLTFLLVSALALKVFWFNRVRRLQTSTSDKVVLVLLFLLFIGASAMVMQESRLQGAVQDAVEETLGEEAVSIKQIDSYQDQYLVWYTVDGGEEVLTSWYEWDDGDMVRVENRSADEAEE